MSRANPIVGRVIERACAEVLIPETGAGTLAWQWTSDGALETTRNGVRIVLGVDPEQGHCVSFIRDGAYDVTDYGKGPYGDLHRAAESSVVAAQIRADFGLGPAGETGGQLPGAAGTGAGRAVASPGRGAMPGGLAVHDRHQAFAGACVPGPLAGTPGRIGV